MTTTVFLFCSVQLNVPTCNILHKPCGVEIVNFAVTVCIKCRLDIFNIPACDVLHKSCGIEVVDFAVTVYVALEVGERLGEAVIVGVTADSAGMGGVAARGVGGRGYG